MSALLRLSGVLVALTSLACTSNAQSQAGFSISSANQQTRAGEQGLLPPSPVLRGAPTAASQQSQALQPSSQLPPQTPYAQAPYPQTPHVQPYPPSINRQEAGIASGWADEPEVLFRQSPFQAFVSESSGKILPQFGHDLFRKVPATFAPVDNIPVTADYVVGPGDEVWIRAWGQVDMDVRAIIDRNGTINLPTVGVFNVSGIRYQDLPAYLKNAFGRYYRSFELTVSLGQLRSIPIFVVGQARRPGSYTVSSLSTIVNAVFAAGGPSENGSMRHIQLKRHNKVVTEFDLYDLLLHGDKSRDVPLQAGDVLYFPPTGSLVAISGGVKIPAIYELKGQEASLQDLISWAGGLASTAAPSRLTVERLDGSKARRVEEFSMDEAGRGRSIVDGDVVTVFSIAPRFTNDVSLKGFVAQPSRFSWKEGIRVSDLIPSKDALVSREFWINRNRPTLQDNKPLDALAVASAKKTELGQVERDLRRTEEVHWDYAVIERLRDDLSTTLVPFNLGRAVLERDPTQNLTLRPGDIITVFSKTDIRVPSSKQARYVRLEGEFVTPGLYQVQEGETLRQLVARIGGITPQAYLFGAEFTRENARVIQQKQLDESLDRMSLEIDRSVGQQLAKATTPEAATAASEQLANQRRMLEKLKGVKAVGRVVLELPAEENLLTAALPDIALENGDRFVVPARPAFVNVFGAVFNPNAYLYKSGRRADDYLDQAGGTTRDADGDSLYVLRADGTVVSRRQSSWLSAAIGGNRLMPGDAVIVPERLERLNFTREFKDWTQIFYQFAMGVAGLKVLQGL